MERLDSCGQWIVVMGFIVSISIFFLALIINQSTLVGQTTSESVLDFSKSDIQDLRNEIFELRSRGLVDNLSIKDDITVLSLDRKNSIVSYSNSTTLEGGGVFRTEYVEIHYNNGINKYDEDYEEMFY